MLYMVVLITMSNTYTTMIRISPAGAAFTHIIISECKGTTVRCMRIYMHWRVSKRVMLLHSAFPLAVFPDSVSAPQLCDTVGKNDSQQAAVANDIIRWLQISCLFGRGGRVT